MNMRIFRKNNIFDNVKNDYDIPIHTVTEECDMDTSKITDDVFEQLGLGRKKKPFSKRAMISVIAAAVAAAVIGTSVIAASQFKTVFDGYIKGEEDTPVYAGDNVKVSSTKTDVTVKGVTCDDTFLFAVLEIKKKDGTPFVESLDDTYILSYDESARNDPNWREIGGYDDQFVFFQELKPDEDDEDYEFFMSDRSGQIEYDFVDTKTIKGFLSYDNSNKYTLQGKTLELQEGKIYIYHRDEVIYSYKDVNNGAVYDHELYQQQAKEIEETYTPLLKENQMILGDVSYKPYDHSIYIITKTEVDVDFEVSFDINYEPKKLVVDVDKEKTYQLGSMNMRFDSIEVYPFSIYLTARYEGKFDWDVFQGDSANPKAEEYFAGLSIEMKDGTIARTGMGMSINSGEEAEDPDTIEVCYRQFVDEKWNLMAINPENIKAIYLGGVKIYG